MGRWKWTLLAIGMLFSVLGSSRAHAVVLFGLDAPGTPLILSDQVVECPSETRDGRFLRSHANGHRYMRGLCSGGLATGVWTGWYENGQKSFVARLEAGKFVGKFRSWHENGKRKAVGYYAAGLRDGKFRYFHRNGSLKAKGHWVADKEAGCWREKYDNGKPKGKGAYVDGSKVGRWIQWTEQGNRGKEVFGGSPTQGRCSILF